MFHSNISILQTSNLYSSTVRILHFFKHYSTKASIFSIDPSSIPAFPFPILHSTSISIPNLNLLNINVLISRRPLVYSNVSIPMFPFQSDKVVLDILVENAGRVNYGTPLDGLKGQSMYH